jgi:transcription elongation factor Elf1
MTKTKFQCSTCKISQYASEMFIGDNNVRLWCSVCGQSDVTFWKANEKELEI